MVKNMVRSMVLGADDALSRIFITLDPSLNSYYEIANPIVLVGDFEVEVEFSTTASILQVLVGDSASTANYLRLDSSGHVDFKSSNDGGNSIVSTAVYNDGKLHTARAVRSGAGLEVFVDGVSVGTSTTSVITDTYDWIGNYSATNYFDGVIANVKITDASTVTTFALNEATSNTESNIEGGNSVTYSTIPEANREVFTLTGEDWIGQELVVNGGFDTDTVWLFLGSGWSIGSGTANCIAVGGASIRQASIYEIGLNYLVENDTITSTTGTLRLFDGATGIIEDISAVGHYENIFTAAGTNMDIGSSSGGFTGSADNVSVKRILEAP